MVFSSTTFLFLFLPLTLLGYLIVPARLRNVWLLLASGFFYLWGAGDQLGVILFVAIASFAGARALVAHRERTGRTNKWLVAAVIAVLLLPLFTVKYLPHLLGLSRDLGLTDAPAISYVLPLGISFFTFHAISFVVDVLRGKVPTERSLRDYLLYIFVFPHQIAGPIVRYGEIREEIKARRSLETGQAAYGITRFGWGLAKKACIADPCGMVADAVFAQAGGDLTAPTAWLGALAYALQIYFDFSGYSDMAIGLAVLFGFHFPENFNAPYRSVSVTDFWRRWHMTLSRWFRDYIYIPLGGSRRGVRREYAALLTTFFLTSLWHGATWPFLVWGGIHSLGLVVERLTGLRNVTGWVIPRRALTALFIVLSWVPFRAPTMGEASAIWQAMFGFDLGGIPPEVLVVLHPWQVAAMAVGLAAFLGPRHATWFRLVFRLRDRSREALASLPARAAMTFDGPRLAAAAVAAPALLGVATVAVFWLDFSPFLYFQF